MVEPSTSPALPWGTHLRQESPPTSPPEHTTPSVGQRVEVKWEVSVGDEEPTCRWWGASVAEGEGAYEGLHKFTLRYDAYGEFAEEEAEVVFLPGNKLKTVPQAQDEECAQVLYYRGEGDKVDPQEFDTAMDSEEEPDVVALHDLDAMGTELELEMGQSVESMTAKAMQENLSILQQQRVAAGFRDFADHFISKLKERVSANGGGESYTVTAEDVRSIVEPFTQRQT